MEETVGCARKSNKAVTVRRLVEQDSFDSCDKQYSIELCLQCLTDAQHFALILDSIIGTPFIDPTYRSSSFLSRVAPPYTLRHEQGSHMSIDQRDKQKFSTNRWYSVPMISLESTRYKS